MCYRGHNQTYFLLVARHYLFQATKIGNISKRTWLLLKQRYLTALWSRLSPILNNLLKLSGFLAKF